MLETERLIIRAFELDDLSVIHRILNQAFGAGDQVDDAVALQARQSWLQWSRLNQAWLPKMGQPPYGDRAIVLKNSDTLIGAAGYVPCFGPFEQIPELEGPTAPSRLYTPEFGLFWVIDPDHQRQGYATEAGQALVDFAFTHLRLKRIIAMTEHSNIASQHVMQKLGMTLTRNPLPEPGWLQVVGVLENSKAFN